MNKSVTLEFPKTEKVFNKQIFDNLTDYGSRIDHGTVVLHLASHTVLCKRLWLRRCSNEVNHGHY